MIRMRWRDLPVRVQRELRSCGVMPKASSPRPGNPGQDRLTAAILKRWPDLAIPEYTPLPGRRYRVDVGFPKWRLAIEVNGWANHGQHLGSFRKDHERMRELLCAGWTVMPFTAREARRADACIAVIEQWLERREEVEEAQSTSAAVCAG
ncbi:hypothetical protein BAE30_04185 [Acidithiobacillus caldus]|uniref:DUF559 domain-containing protein n=1 Tax=Acidithiobacillus caldus TaxID=33059 RepID=A0A1E7YYY8_9PROT|nr:hypothetical protein BAE30_04185 [Acidithiobacillus caldus]